MGIVLAKDELVSLTDDLHKEFPCRELQIQQLAHLLHPGIPSPSTLIIHGLHATGKSSVIKTLLPALKLPHAIIDSLECITARHLFERTVSSCRSALLAEGLALPLETLGSIKCENASVLASHLQRLLSQVSSFTIVFDGIDRQREAPPTLLAALARLGEIIPSLTTVLIVSSPRQRYLHSPGLPHLHFTPYTKAQLLHIVSLHPRPIFSSPPSSPSTTSSDDAADSIYTWTRFIAAVHDSLALPTARDLVSFRSICDRLWPSFVTPIVAGDYGTRDFSKLIVANRSLLRGEEALVSTIIPSTHINTVAPENKLGHELPYYSKLLLISAYLASYNPSRQDSTFFMKAATERKKKRQARRATGEAKTRKISRRLLGPGTFPMERLLAIFYAIMPEEGGVRGGMVDVQTQIATLASLRLLTKTSGAADVLEGHTTKWRVNVGWEFVRRLGRGVGVEVEAWVGK